VGPDGTTRIIKTIGELIRDESGHPVRMVGINYDLTEARRVQKSLQLKDEMLQHTAKIANLGLSEIDAQKALIESEHFIHSLLESQQADESLYEGLKQLETVIEASKKINSKLMELNATKDRLFSIIAHDLRGPFSGFIGLTEELSSNALDLSHSEISEIAAAMNQTAKKMFELLNNLLEWSRLQNNRMDFNPSIIDLYSEIENIEFLFSSAASGKSIKIFNEVPPGTLVSADPYMLNTILRNLISNAIKFSYPRGSIFISSKTSEGFAEISIMDSGAGMVQETIEKVFRVDSGFTTRGTSGEEGSGLGLVLFKDMIQKNGGKIKICSDPGLGTTITFTLPVNPL
ncbi:MAG: ATP-binding protein, partial [Bacillota bacterium]